MAVCSMLYQLATRPEEQQKIHEELKRLMPDPKEPLTIQLLDQMHYLKAFIKEVFRMYSTVIGNGRTLQEDTVICGYRVPKGVSKNPFEMKMYSLKIVIYFRPRFRQFSPQLLLAIWRNMYQMQPHLNPPDG